MSGERRLERADCLEVCLLEGASDCHRLAHGLHLRAEARVRSVELLEGEARHLDDDIVERRLEACGRNFGDVVLQLVESIAHGEKGGDLRDREPRRLRGERGGARDARIHLDDDAPPRLRIDGPLDVRAARRDSDRLENADRVVAHRLVFAVGKCLYRRDGDRVACMDAHCVHVLDGADDHGVSSLVAHHFHLEFLPADERLLDKDLVVERRLESARDDFAELVRVVRDSTARSAEREAGADDERPCADERVGASGLRHVESECFHRRLEEVAVLRAGYRVRIGADHLDAAFREDSGALQLHREVERGLSAERGEKRVRLFLSDDRGHRIHGERFDVGRLGHLRIGHHRRGVGVHEDDFISFLAEGLHGLAS